VVPLIKKRSKKNRRRGSFSFRVKPHHEKTQRGIFRKIILL